MHEQFIPFDLNLARFTKHMYAIDLKLGFKLHSYVLMRCIAFQVHMYDIF